MAKCMRGAVGHAGNVVVVAFNDFRICLDLRARIIVQHAAPKGNISFIGQHLALRESSNPFIDA